MCGFVGFTNCFQVEQPQEVVKKMADRIKHRGPDEENYYVDEDVALGFRRLSIIDLSTGSQPIFNEDRSLVLVYNGEIYNYQQLREELIAKGHVFHSQVDSEVLVHGYEEYGKGLLDKLRGMFAFIIWDKKERKLFGARDYFGIKPFYYYKKGKDFLFASEIKAFLSHPGFVKEFNEALLPVYLCFEYIPNEQTLFKNVYKLPGSHYLEYDLDSGELVTGKYYDIHYQIDESKSLSEWEDQIAANFLDSVKAHKISDVEVGCFLSSGVDSSYVANEFAKMTDDIKTFSVGYEEEKYSELPYAKEFSQSIGVKNYDNKISADDFFGMFPEIQYFMDEPLPNPSAIPLYFLANNAAKYVKVVLSGEGADELFGGYNFYSDALYFDKYSLLPFPLRKLIGKCARHLPQMKGRRFLIRGGQPISERFIRNNYVYPYTERKSILKRAFDDRNPAEWTHDLFERVKDADEVTQMQFADIHTWLVYDILLKADRMSMANSLELRVPFLDRLMLETAMQIPAKYRVSKENTKVALRHAARKQLPAKTANRVKLGFPVPLNDWLKQDKYHDMVAQAFRSPTAQKFFHVDALLSLLEDHRAGKPYMKRIWSIYTFIVWYDTFFLHNGLDLEKKEPCA